MTLCLGSGSYAAGIAEELASRKMLARAIWVAPKLEVWEPRDGSLKKIDSFAAANFLNRAAWAAWRRMPFTRRMQLPILFNSQIADYAASRHIRPGNIFHGITGNALHCLEVARRVGVRTVIEHRMVHPRRWQAEVVEECRRFGVHPKDCDTVLPQRMILRREREFELSDRIVVPSSFAEATFGAEGIRNTSTILPGIDTDLFRPGNNRNSGERFRVCYSGRLELGKGVLYLLKAWKQLGLKDSELVLMGTVRPEIKHALREYQGEDVRITEFVPRTEVAEELRRSSVFVFPSLHEGLAQSLLEAMASGIPAIATPNSGAEDCITDGEDGFIVRPRSSEEIAERIAWCYRNREALEWMGNNARKKVEAKFTTQCYRARLVEFYERLTSGVSAVSTN